MFMSIMPMSAMGVMTMRAAACAGACFLAFPAPQQSQRVEYYQEGGPGVGGNSHP